MNIIVELKAAEQGFAWSTVFGPAATFTGIALSVWLGVRTTRRTLRANILSTSRLKWLEAFRGEFSELLAVGERLYEKDLRSGLIEDEALLRIDLALRSKRLIVLLGREDDDRVHFAEDVRVFAKAPSIELAETLEKKAQVVFREQWNKVRRETGESPRVRSPISRPALNKIDFDEGEPEATRLRRSRVGVTDTSGSPHQ